ncbi:hypothetical protein E2542_SST11946 [Spatholobus suberectus]|nr:hypothetical protein E2542_SST11946 [Spatholobus suberectus]
MLFVFNQEYELKVLQGTARRNIFSLGPSFSISAFASDFECPNRSSSSTILVTRRATKPKQNGIGHHPLLFYFFVRFLSALHRRRSRPLLREICDAKSILYRPQDTSPMHHKRQAPYLLHIIQR